MEDLETRGVRAAKNQSLFREVNEQVRALGARSSTEHRQFVCECLDIDCAETLELELEEYEVVRRHPARFFVLPGHEDPAVEAVVEKTIRYFVVEKIGVAGEVAAAHHPRS
jgi:hypothetical protein